MKNLAFVIEDNEELSILFSRALQAAGYQVEAILDGAIALERISVSRPSLITLDMHLPHVDGTTILAYIRTKEHLRNTFVIVTTADAALGDFHRDVADLVLEKPVSFSQLRDLAAHYRQL